MKLFRFILPALLGITLNVPALTPSPSDTGTEPATVVLLHGMGRSALSMKRLEWALHREGFRVRNVSYPSTRLGIEDLVERHIQPLVEDCQRDSAAPIHFVTHSLGGILVRQLAATHPQTPIGRVVMLAPPNHGSEVTDTLRDWWLYRRLTGPSGQQLGTRATDVPPRLGPATFEVGVIAGRRSFNPLFSSWLPGANDGKVSVATTRLEGMTDFLVVPSTHTWISWRTPVVRQTVAFLHTGKFLR